MPPSEDIRKSLLGVWRLMMGRSDGIRLLDVTADGFWNSFFAIIVALPALLIGWLMATSEFGLDTGETGSRISLVARLALVDLGVWVLPIAGFALVARHVGLRDRMVHVVVAYNWGEALLSWLTLPVTLTFLFTNPARDIADIATLALFVAILVLTWRLTNAALDRGPAAGSAVFAGIFTTSLVVLLLLEALLGIYPADRLSG